MALSANRTDVVISSDRSAKLTPEIKNASVLYYGALVSCDTDTGACKPYDGTESDKLLGWHFEESITGNAARRASLWTGPFVWHHLAVSSLAGSVADIGKRVWATDDGTYTVQDPGGTGSEVGFVCQYIDSSYADVYMHNVAGKVDTLSVLPTPSPTPSPTPTPTPTA